MQRLSALRQSGRTLPHGFFTTSRQLGHAGVSNASGSGSSAGPSSGSSSSQAAQWTRVKHFSDSSRSRPPSSSSRRGQPKPAAATATVASSSAESSSTHSKKDAADETTREAGAEDNAIAAESSEPPIPDQQSATASTSRRGRSKQPLSQQHHAASQQPHPAPSIPNFWPIDYIWSPEGIEARSILTTRPDQIMLDQFYSAGRPLLEVEVIPKHRRRPSINERETTVELAASADETTAAESNSSERSSLAKAEGSVEEESLTDPNAIGPYDALLVTEPNGADPKWGEQATGFLVSMDHHVPPPAPSANDSQAPVTTKKDDLKQRHSAVDYLFPYQAEVRKRTEAEKHIKATRGGSPAYSYQRTQRPIGNDLLGSIMKAAGATNVVHEHEAYGITNRFLSTHLLKNHWSGLWEWDGVHKALAAIGQDSVKVVTQVENEAANETMRSSLERLRKSARTIAKTRARAKRAATEERMRLQKTREIIVVEMPEGRSANSESQAGKDPSESAQELFELIRQAGSFTSLLHQSKEAAKANENESGPESGAMEAAEESGKAISVKIQTFRMDTNEKLSEHFFDSNDVDLGLRSLGAEIDAAVQAAKDIVESEEIEIEEEESLNPLMGPRNSIYSAMRGRNLRPTLRERLAIREVDLIGSHKTISLDSVKRKRRKRISKHK